MKKETRYTCPYCGKKNWNVSVCDNHSELWFEEFQAQILRKYNNYTHTMEIEVDN